MNTYGSEGPGEMTGKMKFARKQQANAATRTATILFHALDVEPKEGDSDMLAKEKKLFNLLQRMIGVHKQN